MYYKKLDEYFKSKGIRKNQVAKTLDVSAAQIGKYLSGKDRISSVMINKIKKNYPDINLEYIFSDTKEELSILSEPNMEPYMNIDFELDQIQLKIGQIREHLARKSHD